MSTTPGLQCPKCNTVIRAGSRYCGNCRFPITASAHLSLSPAPLTDNAIDRAACLQPVNRWILDWPDPTNSIGERLPLFSLSQNYNVDRQKAPIISRHVYRAVFKKLHTD